MRERVGGVILGNKPSYPARPLPSLLIEGSIDVEDPSGRCRRFVKGDLTASVPVVS